MACMPSSMVNGEYFKLVKILRYGRDILLNRSAQEDRRRHLSLQNLDCNVLKYYQRQEFSTVGNFVSRKVNNCDCQFQADFLFYPCFIVMGTMCNYIKTRL